MSETAPGQTSTAPLTAIVLGGSSLVAPFLLQRLVGLGYRGRVSSRRGPTEGPPLPSGFAALQLDPAAPGDWKAPAGSIVFSLIPLPSLRPLLPALGEAAQIVALGTSGVHYKEDSDDPEERAYISSVIETAGEIETTCAGRETRWTLLQPTLVYAPWRDHNVSAIARFIRRFRVFPVATPARGLRQPVHADDVAQAAVAAVGNPRAFDRAFLLSGGETLAYRDMVTRVFESLGRRPLIVGLPAPLLRVGLRLLGGLFGFGYSSAMFDRMNRDAVFDTSEAREALDFDAASLPARLRHRQRRPRPVTARSMRAMVLERPGEPLQLRRSAPPEPAAGQVLLRVHACGVCRTDLHLVDGELPDPKLPIVPGHEIVGRIEALGPGPSAFAPGQRVGIPWLGWTCGNCDYCRRGRENLCERAGFTGYSLDGGYADYALADQRYCFALPDHYSDAEAAPLLCAGLIGHRALTMAGEAKRLGLYGFGAAAHIVAQVARHEGRQVFAFVRPGDLDAKVFATSLGAVWAGDSDETPPEPLDAAILFAPVGALVPAALRAVVPGGTVVCAGIHMSDIPSFPYELLWRERRLLSVANLTRADGEAFLALAPKVPVQTSIEPLPLEQANEALTRLREGRLQGAAVLMTGAA